MEEKKKRKKFSWSILLILLGIICHVTLKIYNFLIQKK